MMANRPQVYRNYDLLFTPYLIPRLRNLRGKEWAELIDRLSVLPETHLDVLAFAMMMIKLGGCLPCQMDSYRAQRGCALCARNTILSFKGSDEQLITCYENARKMMAEQITEFEMEQAA